MKNWWKQVLQYPAQYCSMLAGIMALLVALQFNWAHTNNFWGDITTRVVAAILISPIIFIPYSIFIINLLVRLTGFEPSLVLRKMVWLHLPLFAGALVIALPQNASIFFVIAGGGFAVLLWLLFIYPQEKKVKDNIAAHAPFFLMVVAVIAALGARKMFTPVVSQDTYNWVIPWLNYIQEHGLASYGGDLGGKYNYSPFYSYLLGIGSVLPLTDLEIIKYISILFDLLSAWYISRMVKLRFPASPMLPVLAFTSFLFLPTIMLNSSYWGQCDIIYVAFSLGAMYYLMLPDTRKNNVWAVCLYALALSVKLQAMLIAPLFAIAWFRRDIKLTDFLLIPGVYLLLMVPCLIAGRNFMDVLLVYFRIVDDNPVLTANSPNMYQLLGDNFKVFNGAGVLVSIGVQAILVFGVVWKLKDKPLSMDLLAHCAFLITLTMPFLMPRMHERYFILAESISLLFAFYNPRYFYMPLAIGIISLFTYTGFLFAKTQVPYHILTLGVLVLILITGYSLVKKLRA